MMIQEKLNHRIRGLLVIGNRTQIPNAVRAWKVRKAIIAMPSVPGRVIRDLVEICNRAEIETLTLPGINDVLNGNGSLGRRVRKIRIEDLLRRELIQTDIQQVHKLLQGKRILITGAGGSIGSELCRQILRCSPLEIVLLGHGENSVFQIQQELQQLILIESQRDDAPRCQPRLIPFIADLRHPFRLACAFEQFRPEIIFHAAAHKHVPLMEDNISEAITNNVLGTKELLDLAVRYDVQRFVMISTDKAVNPTNVMGASKRVAEMLVLQAAQRTSQPFVVVRFGNVLGSRGSVIPTFQQQILSGGPVTVTHPEICRYFMTIPEAVQLTLQAVVISPGGEVVMLDMGEPVKIVDLARDLINLSGYEVDKDIEIRFTGLRPGEKLFEELFLPSEEYQSTRHEKLLVVSNASHSVPEYLDRVVADLQQAAVDNRTEAGLPMCENSPVCWE
jgi:FlaA1/EpsC-like NDP-sugar epimerase